MGSDRAEMTITEKKIKQKEEKKKRKNLKQKPKRTAVCFFSKSLSIGSWTDFRLSAAYNGGHDG